MSLLYHLYDRLSELLSTFKEKGNHLAFVLPFPTGDPIEAAGGAV